VSARRRAPRPGPDSPETGARAAAAARPAQYLRLQVTHHRVWHRDGRGRGRRYRASHGDVPVTRPGGRRGLGTRTRDRDAQHHRLGAQWTRMIMQVTFLPVAASCRSLTVTVRVAHWQPEASP
jgi:hypothetical protein